MANNDKCTQITELLGKARSVHLNDNADLVLTLVIDPEESITVSDDVLNLFHPQLAATLRANIRISNIKVGSLNILPPQKIQLLMDLVSQGPLRLQSIYGPDEILFSKILNITDVEDDNFLIEGMKLGVDLQNNYSSTIYVIRHTTRYSMEVSGEYLDKHFSQWRQRWNIGLGVGLGDESLMTHVFRPNFSPVRENSPLTSELTFD